MQNIGNYITINISNYSYRHMSKTKSIQSMRYTSHDIRVRNLEIDKAKQTENLLWTAQRAMERAMLGIALRDWKRTVWIREKLK